MVNLHFEFFLFNGKHVKLNTVFPPPYFLSKAVVSVDGKPVRLQLCDTAGQVSGATYLI